MLYINNQGITDPEINLAIEEYALRNLPEEETYLLFYVNGPSIIIGKNQNTIEEINKEYVDEKGIQIVRRLSGGGAVYHDLGNLNFSFITKDDGESFLNFQKFTEPVIATLNRLGVEAVQSGRNDIHVGERKISGNAQYTTRGRMFSHGTLMLDSDVEEVVNALNVSDEKIRSKGIKSVRSRVANINEFLDEKLDVDQLKNLLLQSIFNNDIKEYKLTEKDWEGIYKLSKDRYQTWDWNYGKSPKFDLKRSKRFDAGTIDIRLNVSKGTIQECKIYGDFFGVGDVSDVEGLLVGTKYEKNAIHEALKDLNTSYYFGNISRESIIELIY